MCFFYGFPWYIYILYIYMVHTFFTWFMCFWTLPLGPCFRNRPTSCFRPISSKWRKVRDGSLAASPKGWKVKHVQLWAVKRHIFLCLLRSLGKWSNFGRAYFAKGLKLNHQLEKLRSRKRSFHFFKAFFGPAISPLCLMYFGGKCP